MEFLLLALYFLPIVVLATRTGSVSLTMMMALANLVLGWNVIGCSWPWPVRPDQGRWELLSAMMRWGSAYRSASESLLQIVVGSQ